MNKKTIKWLERKIKEKHFKTELKKLTKSKNLTIKRHAIGLSIFYDDRVSPVI